ncbi:MAG: hypothetical protein F9K40_00265 [Kofleriaceae bacterium]|nr:MAG: hypothetical protein F9K40_00265 [Kofleriaceae bacterium]MBZ0233810.1 hypothetical protein [Kofleriaceae bacterium]
MTRFSTPALCLSLFAALAACRDSSNGDDDGTDVDAANGEQTVFQVQSDDMPPGTPVTLRGVVVTAVDNFANPRDGNQYVGNFYVAEPEGGAFSGVLVHGAPLDQVAQLAVGDLVDITSAEKDEFSWTGDDKTNTEVVPLANGEMTVTKVGPGTVPAPQVLDALMIGQMAETAREAEYEKWEGVLVRVENVSVTSEIRPINQDYPPEAKFVKFSITGVLEVDSSLAEIPYSETGEPWLSGGDCLMSVTGMGDYFYNYKVLPRATADIVMGGTSCPAPEAPGTCTDGIDNDANGFMDCADRGCDTEEPTCTSDTTVANVQMGMHNDGDQVRIADAVVTAIGRGPTNIQTIWVADSATAGPYNGLQVYRGTNAGMVPAGVVVGAHVTLQGEVDEFNDASGTGTLTQLRSPTITVIPGTPEMPVPATDVPLATLIDDTTGEPYEGVLVELENVRMTGTPTGQTFGVRYFGTQAAPSTILFQSDDDIRSALTQADGTCFSLIRGIWSYGVYDNRWQILPLAGADDVVVAGDPNACP